MQPALKYSLELLIVIMLNICAIAFAGAWYRTLGGNPYVHPPAPPAATSTAALCKNNSQE